MGYQMQRNNRYAQTLDVTIAKGAVVAAVGVVGSAFELGDQSTLRLNLNATAASAGVSATVTVETSPDGSTGWTAVAAFTAVTAVGNQRKVFVGLDRFVRLNVTALTGTGASVTFDATGESC